MSKYLKNLPETLISLGFTSFEIQKLIYSYNRYKDNFKTLEELKEYYNNYKNNMLKLGYDEKDIRLLASTHPKSIFQKFTNGELEEYYQRYLDIKEEKSEELSTEEKKDKNRYILFSVGINPERIDYIFSTNIIISEMDPSTLSDNVKFYISCGIKDSKLNSIVNSNSTALLFGLKEYGIILEEFKFFTKSDLGEMILYYSSRDTLVQPDSLYKTLKFIKEKKLDIVKTKKWLKKNLIKNVDKYALEANFDNLIKIGFTSEQANIAVSEFFALLYKPTEKIEYIIEVARMYGINKEDMIGIITGFPTLTDLKEEKMREKIAVMARYNLTEYVKTYPKSLIEGAELIDARAYYLRMFHPGLSYMEFASDIFLAESAFERKYSRPNDYIKELRNLLKR